MECPLACWRASLTRSSRLARGTAAAQVPDGLSSATAVGGAARAAAVGVGNEPTAGVFCSRWRLLSAIAARRSSSMREGVMGWDLSPLLGGAIVWLRASAMADGAGVGGLLGAAVRTATGGTRGWLCVVAAGGTLPGVDVRGGAWPLAVAGRGSWLGGSRRTGCPRTIALPPTCSPGARGALAFS